MNHESRIMEKFLKMLTVVHIFRNRKIRYIKTPYNKWFFGVLTFAQFFGIVLLKGGCYDW